MMENICNKSDFIITVSLVDKDGIVIPYSEIDWEIWYYTNINFPYKVTHKNGVLSSNAEIVDNNVVIYVNGYDWGVLGGVYRRAFCSFPDAHFIDGKADICSEPQAVTTFKII
jgi:hypothetical protein